MDARADRPALIEMEHSIRMQPGEHVIFGTGDARQAGPMRRAHAKQ